VILGKFWSRFDLRQRRNRKFLVDDQGCLSKLNLVLNLAHVPFHVPWYLLKINASKFTHGLEPLYGDACSAKSLEVLTLVFSTDCSPIDWLQSALKIKRFENIFLFFLFFENQASRSWGVKLD